VLIDVSDMIVSACCVYTNSLYIIRCFQSESVIILTDCGHSYKLLDLWPPNSPDLNPIDYRTCGIIQQRVHRTEVQYVMQRLTCGLERKTALFKMSLTSGAGVSTPAFEPQAGSILSVESNQNVESKTKNVQSKTEKCGVQNSIWSVDSQENH